MNLLKYVLDGSAEWETETETHVEKQYDVMMSNRRRDALCSAVYSAFCQQWIVLSFCMLFGDPRNFKEWLR